MGRIVLPKMPNPLKRDKKTRGAGGRRALKAAPVFIVSGGTGASGLQLVNTILAQFPGLNVPVVTKAHVKDVEDLHEVLGSAGKSGGIVVHTLVDSHLRNMFNSLGVTYGVFVVDLMGALIDRLTSILGTEPVCRPGLYRSLNREYFDRVDAIEFSMDHDDGQGMQDISGADIVLLGASRVGKTPLAMYLAMKGYKTANVPLVSGQMSPESIMGVDAGRVIGLLIDAERLAAFRRERKEKLGLPGHDDYSDLRKIFNELEQARIFFKKKGYAVIDVTDKPLETSADEVMKIITRRFGEKSDSA